MEDAVHRLGQALLNGGLAKLTAREQRVIRAVAERCHISRDAGAVQAEAQSFGEGLADQVARFGGSWTFIGGFVALLLAWIALNSLHTLGVFRAFDPYPFIFLNLVLSMVAALQAPVILMSQNRQAARDRIAASLDYEVNLKAEIEITALHEKIDRLRLDRVEDLIAAQGVRLQALADRLSAG